MTTPKITWQGTVVSIQPRIRLLRSFDQRSHSYLGYLLRIDGTIGNETRVFTVDIGKAAQAKFEFCVGDEVSGAGVPAANPQTEPAEFYRVSRLKLLARGAEPETQPPPWHGLPPNLEAYRARGHRRLAARTYESTCLSCIWGCRMAVEIIIDQWNPGQKRYRSETFCYGPKSCMLYRPGPQRRVPGRKGMMWVEEDWVDDDATAHRGPDE